MIGICTDSEFDLELNASHSLVEIKEINRGRGARDEVSNEVRKLVASEAIAGADVNELSEAFNISKSSVSAYKNGATSTSSYHNPDRELERSNNETRKRIIGPAQDTLIRAIEAISPDKLNDSKPQVASAVARDMSSIIKNMQPDASVTVNNNRVVIYKPRMREEDDYEIMVVEE